MKRSGKQYRRSLKTKDRKLAERFLAEFRQKVDRLDHTKVRTSLTFAECAKQWYVTISRGRKRIVVLTPDKAKLRANIQRSGARDLAVQDTSGDASQRMGMPGTTEHAREAMELARRHQTYAQQFNQAQQAGQRI